MSGIQWNSRFSLGLEKIDEEHQELFRILNSLVSAIEHYHEKEELGSIFEALIRYADVHFSHEEAFLESVSYPELDKHRKEHESFLKITEDYRNRYMDGEIALSLRILDFLVTWLKNHILGSDMKYSDYIKAAQVN